MDKAPLGFPQSALAPETNELLWTLLGVCLVQVEGFPLTLAALKDAFINRHPFALRQQTSA